MLGILHPRVSRKEPKSLDSQCLSGNSSQPNISMSRRCSCDVPSKHELKGKLLTEHRLDVCMGGDMYAGRHAGIVCTRQTVGVYNVSRIVSRATALFSHQCLDSKGRGIGDSPGHAAE